MKEDNKKDDKLQKIRISVPICFDLKYLIEVKNPKDINEILEILEQKNPEEWECSCFL